MALSSGPGHQLYQGAHEYKYRDEGYKGGVMRRGLVWFSQGI